jgi:hypothetical protein
VTATELCSDDTADDCSAKGLSKQEVAAAKAAEAGTSPLLSFPFLPHAADTASAQEARTRSPTRR